MKRFLLGLLCVMSLCGCVQAANPSFSSFATNHFITNNFLIRARLNPSQFDTNASAITITLTNVAGVPGGGSLWTNSAGVLQPLGHNDGTNQFTIAEATGWTGAGTNAFFDDGMFSGVAVINPTDTYIPYRANAYTLEDSPWYVVSTNAAINSQIIFGPGDTNVLYRSGNDLVYTNTSTAAHGFTVENPNTVANFFAGGGLAITKGSNGASLSDQFSQEMRWFSKYLAPSISDSSIGADNTGPASLYPIGSVNSLTNMVYGFRDSIPTNYSRLAISHTGTNGYAKLNSESSGTAGDPKNFMFQFGGTNRLEIGQQSGTAPYIHFHETGNATISSFQQNAGYLNISSTTGLQLTSPVLTEFADEYSLFGYNTGTPTVDLYGFASGADYSRFRLQHTGTNGAVVLDSQSAGTAGSPRPHTFALGATNQFSIGDGWIQLMRGMTKAEKATITPTNGMVVYQTDNTPGFRGYVNGSWVIFSTAADP